MCVSISNVTVVVQLNNRQLIHASINNLNLDGSILPRSQIALCVIVDAFSCRLLQTAMATNERLSSKTFYVILITLTTDTYCRFGNSKVSNQAFSPETRSKIWQPCLAEFSVGLQFEIHVDPMLQAITVN